MCIHRRSCKVQRPALPSHLRLLMTDWLLWLQDKFQYLTSWGAFCPSVGYISGACWPEDILTGAYLSKNVMSMGIMSLHTPFDLDSRTIKIRHSNPRGTMTCFQEPAMRSPVQRAGDQRSKFLENPIYPDWYTCSKQILQGDQNCVKGNFLQNTPRIQTLKRPKNIVTHYVCSYF